MRYFKKCISLFLCLVMLLSVRVCAENTTIITYSNGNDVTESSKFNNGIFSAVSSGSGLFAIALYEEDELAKLSFAQNEEELNEYRVNMLIEDAEKYTMKVFRFDQNGNPLCVNENLSPEITNHRIYVNESFDNGSDKFETNTTTKLVESGKVKVSGNGTRFGTVAVNYPEQYIIVEADFELPSSAECFSSKLISSYTDSPKGLVVMTSNGIKTGSSGSLPILVPDETVESDGKFNIAVKIDLESFTYDFYYNRKKMTTTPSSLSGKINPDTKYKSISFHIPTIEESGKIIYVDNIKIYGGNEFLDIAGEIVNVHNEDFTGYSGNESDIYERPEAAELAEKSLATGHPRVIINSARVEEIKNSDDSKIAQMKESVISQADSYLTMGTYSYAYSNTGSIGDVSESRSLMMNLGMAYLLTGDTRYSDRAYREAEALYDVKSTYVTDSGKADYWNSYSYLSVAEISAIIAVCYDWMYDAWTPAQREALSQNVMEKGLLRSYRGYFNMNDPDSINPTNFKYTNNWGAVCNGGVLMSAIAFMESDPYMCSQIAEACIRALEYFLPSYAPAGAWAEGASYWAYALRYLTYACATLDSACGTDYGISKTQGLKGTQLYSIASEGKTGVVNFGDVGSSRVNAPFMFYWANKFKDSQIGGAAAYIKSHFGFNYNVMDLLYYNPEYVAKTYEKPLSFYYSGTELVSFEGGVNDTDAYVAMSGGKGVATSHDHLDSGSIIAEKNGVRIISDTGAEHYGAKQYFADNRYWYYKARPEGHNIFVINPQNLYDANGTTYYHGQSRDAVSEIAAYSSAEKTATMDLSAAYSRDAQKATRKISLVENDIVIEDEITVLSDGSLLEWYWHFKDTATAVVSDTTKYSSKTYCEWEISDDKKSVTLTFYDYTYNSGFTFPGTSKSFCISFETDEEYEIEIRDAVRNTYDADVITGLKTAGKLSDDYYNSRNVMSKIVVKMENVSGTVKLKTIIE